MHIHEIGQSLEDLGWLYWEDSSSYIQTPIPLIGDTWVKHVSTRITPERLTVTVFTHLFIELGERNSDRGVFFEQIWRSLPQMSGYIDYNDGQFVLKLEPLFVGEPDPTIVAEMVTQLARTMMLTAEWLCPIIRDVGFAMSSHDALTRIRSGHIYAGSA